MFARDTYIHFFRGVWEDVQTFPAKTDTRSTSDDNIFPNADGGLQVYRVYVGNVLVLGEESSVRMF